VFISVHLRLKFCSPPSLDNPSIVPTVKAMHPGLEDLFTLLRFASVSTDPSRDAETRACAEWLVAKLRRIGLTPELHETARHPVVIARNAHQPDRKTVMIYGHYDVQPAEPLDEWRTPAFEPTVVDGRILCRGATDNKGQLMAHLRGVEETLAATGDLPVNLIFLFEGEEEIGSPNLKPFLQAHAAELKCDLVAISDTGMIAPGKGTFTYGLRGIVCCEVKVKGPSIDLHSGIFGGAVMNPNTALARLAATLHHADGRVAVEGFYDDVRPLEAWERQSWQALGDTAAETQELSGSPELFGEAGYTDMERRWARPTAEINGIGGGYQGAGSKTVIPREAFMKLSFRLVPDQQPEKILEQVKAHLLAHTPPGVVLDIHDGHNGMPYVMDPHGPLGAAAQRALTETFGGSIALIREGGSIPIVQAFKDVLGVDTLLLGLALPDCQAHAPNENFPIANFEAGVALNKALLRQLASAV
jgi:acetylornithine deacetylase/succinyl-diaminopimelate desuccinylase-like protein